MEFSCEICYENSEPTQYKCKCPEIRCCKLCIDKWTQSNKTHCPFCQNELEGLLNFVMENKETTDRLLVFAMSYNALHILNGFGGITYS